MLASAVALLIREGTTQRHRALPGVEQQIAVVDKLHSGDAVDLQPDLGRVGTRRDDQVVFEPLRVAVEHGVDAGIEIVDCDPCVRLDIRPVGTVGTGTQVVDPGRLRVEAADGSPGVAPANAMSDDRHRGCSGRAVVRVCRDGQRNLRPVPRNRHLVSSSSGDVAAASAPA